jgi:hypothetical protein
LAKKNKQLSAEQKKLQQQLESYARQSIDHEEKCHGTSTAGSGRETEIR